MSSSFIGWSRIQDLRPIATSIENECGHAVSRSRLIAEISNQLEALYGQLETGEFMAESRARSNVIGRDVLVIRGAPEEKGPRLSLEEALALVERYREEGLPLKEAAKKAAGETGHSRNDLYHASLIREKEESLPKGEKL